MNTPYKYDMFRYVSPILLLLLFPVTGYANEPASLVTSQRFLRTVVKQGAEENLERIRMNVVTNLKLNLPPCPQADYEKGIENFAANQFSYARFEAHTAPHISEHFTDSDLERILKRDRDPALLKKATTELQIALDAGLKDMQDEFNTKGQEEFLAFIKPYSANCPMVNAVPAERSLRR